MKLQNMLKEIVTLSFTSQTIHKTGWSGTGEGNVSVEDRGNTILLHENGKWTNDKSKTFTFKNTYRWEFKSENVVSLEHLRFGSENPVYLFDLKQISENYWKSACDHVCQMDLYGAELKLEENRMLLNWTVKGPEKDESINYVYNLIR